MIRGKDIVCISSLDWEAHWTSKQQIMYRLAETNRVLYVEEPVTALAPFKVPSRWSRWKAVVPELRKVRPGLWVLTPPPLAPFGNMYPRVNDANQRLLAGYVNWAVREIGMERPLLWTYLPGSFALIDHLSPAAVIYHCVDEHSAFPGFVRPEVVKAYDDELTRRSDLVLTSGRNLLLSRQDQNEYIHHIPHAADVRHFAKALDPALQLPPDLAAISRPRIGVVGVHDERLDVATLEVLARTDSAWQIVVVGPVVPGDVDEGRLASLPNVHFLGGKTVAQLPSYLKGLDVALIPYRLNELTRNIFPLKLYEYLAAGLPVVAAALPELAGFAEVVLLAHAPEEYPALVRQALESDSPQARAARAASVADETWDKRVGQISSLVEEMLARVDAEGRAVPATGWGPRDTAAPARRRSSVSVLGFPLDLVTLDEAAQWVMDVATGAGIECGRDGRGAGRPRAGDPGRGDQGAGVQGRAESDRTAIVVSFNPELVMAALADPPTAEVLHGSDLSFPDGVGAVWAARRQIEPGPVLDPGPERVAGIDLARRVLELAAEAGTPVYFLGGRSGVAESAAVRQSGSLPGLRVAGCRDGYFSSSEEPAVVEAVRASGAAILFIGMGAPKQENLLYRHRDDWGVRVALGIGGSFDVWAGNTARAPGWIRGAGLEWLYRLAREPKRLRRQAVLPRYVYRVIMTGSGEGGSP